VRKLVFFAAFLAGCARPEPVTAITLTHPLAPPPAAPVVDRTAERIAAAREDIAAERWDAAARALLAIVCGDREVTGESDLARCVPAPGMDATEAWGLLGQLALDGHVVLRASEWTAAQRVVSRWSQLNGEATRDDLQLGVAEIAFSRATVSQTSHTTQWLYELGVVQQKRKRFGRAVGTFVKVLDANSSAFQKDAVDRVVEIIGDFDWDGDGTEDDVRGFARPEVHAALSAQKPYVAEVYVRALEELFDDDRCDEARAGMAELVRRFPSNPAIGRLTGAMSSCP
jgi:hypothetical protein